MDKNLTKDKSVGTEVSAPCAGTCSGMTNHTVMASMDRTGDSNDVYWWSRHQVVMCDGCKELSFRQVAGNSEDYEQISENEWINHEHIQLYPARRAGARGLGDDVSRLPTKVAILYEETRTTLLNACPVLTGIGLRALVESVCKEKSSRGSNLQEQIEGLVGMGILTQASADVLHKIRTMGNEAAHEAKPHPDEQLLLAVEVVEHLLKSVYIMPHKLKNFAKPKPSAKAPINSENSGMAVGIPKIGG